MEVKATLEHKISKDGNPYECIVIKLTEDYDKIVFLDRAELALLKKCNNNNPEIVSNPFDFK